MADIGSLYNQLLGRSASAEEIAFWQQQAAQGTDVASAIGGSSEALQRQYDPLKSQYDEQYAAAVAAGVENPERYMTYAPVNTQNASGGYSYHDGNMAHVSNGFRPGDIINNYSPDGNGGWNHSQTDTEASRGWLSETLHDIAPALVTASLAFMGGAAVGSAMGGGATAGASSGASAAAGEAAAGAGAIDLGAAGVGGGTAAGSAAPLITGASGIPQMVITGSNAAAAGLTAAEIAALSVPAAAAVGSGMFTGATPAGNVMQTTGTNPPAPSGPTPAQIAAGAVGAGVVAGAASGGGGSNYSNEGNNYPTPTSTTSSPVNATTGPNAAPTVTIPTGTGISTNDIINGVGTVADAVTSNAASNAQQAASANAIAEARRQYDLTRQDQLALLAQQRADQAPWLTAGTGAINQLAQLTAPGGEMLKSFTQADFQADPGYAFRQAEGQKALERSAAARGGLLSGAALKATERYSQGIASEEYGNAYNRFNNDKSTKFNRLASLAGVGQQAVNQVGQAGQSAYGTIANAGNVASTNVQNGITGAGNARASGYVGMANALNNGISTYFNNQQSGNMLAALLRN